MVTTARFWAVVLTVACCHVAAVEASAATGAVEGRVMNEDREPLAGVRVTVVSPAPVLSGAATGVDGEFRIDGVPSGTHTVRFELIGYLTVNWQFVRVRRGRTTRLDLRMPTEPATEIAAVIGDSGLGQPSDEQPHELGPWIHPHMPLPVRQKLDIATELAGQRVREVPECHALFADLGADGAELLDRTLYFPAKGYGCRGVTAYTFIGARVVRLCSRFGSLPDEQAAVVLIHEALHNAGLPEYPYYRRGPHPRQIDHSIESRCGL